MEHKIQVYYQPCNNPNMKSLTISYYDVDIEKLTYRFKVVLERDDGKYKIKEYWGNLGSILPGLKAVDLTKYPAQTVDKSQEFFYIKTASSEYLTNNRADIEDILKLVHFERVLNFDISKYKKER